MQLYEFSTISIAITLFLAISFFNEIGFAIGHFVQKKTTDEVKSLTGSIQGSILGLLALLLGFTFSMSIQKYDARTTALIDEAASIKQVMMASSHLPNSLRPEFKLLLEQYVETKLELAELSIVEDKSRQKLTTHVESIQQQMWQLTDNNALQNDVALLIERDFKRNALINNYAPEVVLYLLFFVFVIAVTILGYSAGLSGKRLTIPISLVGILITLIVYIIIDLDRPKRGLITTEMAPLHLISKQLKS